MERTERGNELAPDFPTTPGAYDREYAAGGRSVGARGLMDAFVAKLDRRGQMVWSSLLGGPNYDRACTVRVDKNGFVYVAGRAGEGFPTTPGTVQPVFAGDNQSSPVRPSEPFRTTWPPSSSST